MLIRLRRCFAASLLFVTCCWSGQSAPVTLQTLRMDDDTVSIYRDSYGVPRIFAATPHGLFVANGYAVAQDRLWQMERYRLAADGRLAEVFGEKFIDSDKEVRRDGMTQEEWHQEFLSMPQTFQEMFAAYVEGVNLYMDEVIAKGQLPPEFGKYDWKPARWTIEDSMAIVGMMSRRFGASGTDQIRNQEIVEYLTKRLGSRSSAMRVFNDLAYVDDPAAVTTIESRSGASLKDTGKSQGDSDSDDDDNSVADLPIPWLQQVQAEANSAAVYSAAHDLALPIKWGSYAWVLSGTKSVSGSPLLLGGPQMGFETPQIAHEVQLTGAGYNVMGMGFAGTPGVLIGMNDHLAFTTTSGLSHNEDIFTEKLAPGDEHRYVYKGKTLAMEHRVERILVRGGQPIDYDVYRTVHGPVVAWSPDKTMAYAKGMTYFKQDVGTIVGVLGFDTSKTLADFARNAAKIVTNHNFLVATQDGDIGYWLCGLFPIYHKGSDPRLPLAGTGEQDWQGFVPFAQVPHATDPSIGMFFNWNNKPAAGWRGYAVPGMGCRLSHFEHPKRSPALSQGARRKTGAHGLGECCAGDRPPRLHSGLPETRIGGSRYPNRKPSGQRGTGGD